MEGRRGTIEIQEQRSKWFSIHRDGPQESSLTPSLFITYHSDTSEFLPKAMSFFFADDVAAVVAEKMGEQFTVQCIDLERRLNKLLEHLEFYAILSVQPIHYSKTVAIFSALAVNYSNPMPVLRCGNVEIKWVSAFKYLDYWLTTKLEWGNVIQRSCLRVRQQIGLVNSIRFAGITSSALRCALFSTFVLPFFTWLSALYPLFTNCQQSNLNHFYYTYLKRVMRFCHWSDFFFASAYNEPSLDDRCFRYWIKYCQKLTSSVDGRLLAEQLLLNNHRARWIEHEFRIRSMWPSKRYNFHLDMFTMALDWMARHGTTDSVVSIDNDANRCFAEHPDTF